MTQAIGGTDMEVRARFELNGQLRSGVVVNPGECGGKAWLVYVDDCHDPDLFVVEADTFTKAEEEFVESEHGKRQRIDWSDSADREDYDPETCHYTGSGTPYVSEGIMVCGQEGADLPWDCRYFAPGLPSIGVTPDEFQNYERAKCHYCAGECYALPEQQPFCDEQCKQDLDATLRW